MPSDPIALVRGPTSTDVLVTAADGKTGAKYTVVVNGSHRNDYFKASNN